MALLWFWFCFLKVSYCLFPGFVCLPSLVMKLIYYVAFILSQLHSHKSLPSREHQGNTLSLCTFHFICHLLILVYTGCVWVITSSIEPPHAFPFFRVNWRKTITWDWEQKLEMQLKFPVNLCPCFYIWTCIGLPFI